MANSCIIKPMPGKLVSKKKVFGGLLVAGCILTQLAVATPQVANVSGSANHGSKVTVSGSGFGAKSTAARPVVWDPCSTAGLSSQWSGGWPNASPSASDNIQCRPPTRGISLPHNNSGMYLAGSHGGNNGYNAGWNVMVYKTRTLSSYPQYTYASWYQRSDDHWTFCGDNNYKVWDFSSASDPYQLPNNWYLEYNPRPTSTTSIPSWHMIDDAGSVGLQPTDINGHDWWWGPAVNPMSGKWTKVEVEIRYDKTSSGYIHMWENGVQKINYDGKTDGYAGTTRSEAIGGYARCSGYETNWRYFSDLYLDYSRARVMLANNANYASATIIEPQLVDSWSDSSISLTVNRGTIPAGQSAYVFVVTDAGVRSSPGIAIGSSASGTKVPDPPADVTVQ